MTQWTFNIIQVSHSLISFYNAVHSLPHWRSLPFFPGHVTHYHNKLSDILYWTGMILEVLNVTSFILRAYCILIQYWRCTVLYMKVFLVLNRMPKTTYLIIIVMRVWLCYASLKVAYRNGHEQSNDLYDRNSIHIIYTVCRAFFTASP